MPCSRLHKFGVKVTIKYNEFPGIPNQPVMEIGSSSIDQNSSLPSSTKFAFLGFKRKFTDVVISIIFTLKVKIWYGILIKSKFHDKKLFNLCESQNVATIKLGSTSAKKTSQEDCPIKGCNNSRGPNTRKATRAYWRPVRKQFEGTGRWK